ncbi:carboxymuconolactone decarboxylase family protein [Streptomyces cavernicola]|uniref:Carboxymuconolactone decarboxylase family protein n=1 Tax=Streptomyces cavernicola TaxID=3043613 RepID=A0ABT6SGE5_9ACTN|nr:carboxymuconolactone decarboxylase family protein [Streptomyces sp. B-S-A6]MDI3406974.1 carboxymuconolactone decarboxylase family protein [Streptomyces sp. B-S-A6]
MTGQPQPQPQPQAQAATPRTPYRYTDPTPPQEATGTAAELYAQMAVDFGIPEPAPFVVLSSAPELFAPAWALMRESLLAGPGSRTGKKVAALGVSLANRCPFCVDAHTLLLHATGERDLADTVTGGGVPETVQHARVLAWAQASRTPGAPELAQVPFAAADAAGYIGTVLAFHFINRIASALLHDELMPEGVRPQDVLRSPAGEALAQAMRRTPEPGASLRFLPPTPQSDPNQPSNAPSWAAGTPVAPAYEALRAAASMGAGLLSEEDQALVRGTVDGWDGAHPPLHWPELPGADRPGARLAVLAALAPYRITEEDVAAWLTPPHTDHCLVHLVAYGAFLAVERVERALAAAWTGVPAAGRTRP